MNVLNWTRTRTGCLAAVLYVSFIASIQAQTVERVLVKEGQLLMVQDKQTLPVEKEISLPGEIKVQTNATFTVKEGKPRPLKEGQILGADGMLSSPDGSVIPVFDHINMTKGRPLLYRDGAGSALTAEFALGNGTRVTPDGYFVSRTGSRTRLMDGEMFRLDGSGLAAKDTISLKGGKVVVQKDGGMITLPPGRTLMMNDGTRVNGDGTVTYKDGTSKKLTEGETLTIEGIARKR